MRSRVTRAGRRLRRRREGSCTAAEHAEAVREYHALQRLRALECIRAGMFDDEVCSLAKITQARLDAWFVADASFWNARRAFRDECLATIREAAKHGDSEARRWLLDRNVSIEGS
jgi:hypothetical protein